MNGQQPTLYWIKMIDLIPNWPAPSNISALTTTRDGGISLPPYSSNNLAFHVDDEPEHVSHNRSELAKRLLLPAQPAWLEQTHTNHCVIVEDDPNRHADAAISRSIANPLAIMTADCLPILLCNRAGTEIAAVHAGWKGLLNGIVENTINKMHTSSRELMAWIGPAICHRCYETGHDVREAYIGRYPYTKNTFLSNDTSVHANLPKMAELILHASGVDAIYQSGACTFELEKQFYSYRRQAQTGRMATLIWFNQR